MRDKHLFVVRPRYGPGSPPACRHSELTGTSEWRAALSGAMDAQEASTWGSMKGVVPAHLKDRFDYLDRLAPADPSLPWRKVPTVHVGGLWHAGFGDRSDLLLLVSVSGRGVVACSSGEKLARDDADYYPGAGTLEAEGIGPLRGELVRIAGVSGGGLSRATSDGWSIELHPLSWPDDELILCPPGQTMLWQAPDTATCVVKLPPMASALVAFGFSPTGKSLVVATSSDVTIYNRD